MAIDESRLIAVLKAVVDRKPIGAAHADRDAIAGCLARGWLYGDETDYALTMEGADALRPHQIGATTGEALAAALNDQFEASRNAAAWGGQT